jgi:hypothetical protein
MADVHEYSKRLQRFTTILKEDAQWCKEMTDEKKSKRKKLKELIDEMAEIIRMVRRQEGESVPLEQLLNSKTPNAKAKLCFLNITKGMSELQTFYDNTVNPKMVLFKETNREFDKLIDAFDADHKKLDKGVSLQMKAAWDAIGKALQALKKDHKDHLKYVDSRSSKRGIDAKKFMQKIKNAVDIDPYIMSHDALDDDL